MESFRGIAVVLSMILGLGVTRLLSSCVEVFRSRGQTRQEAITLLYIPLSIWAALNLSPASY